MQTWQRQWIKECLLNVEDRREKTADGLRSMFRKMINTMEKSINCFNVDKKGDAKTMKLFKRLFDLAFTYRYPGIPFF